jgi:hypothetical protein
MICLCWISEDPIKIRHASTEFPDRCGGERSQNQYFSSTGNFSSAENWPRISQLVQAPGFSLGSGFALGSSHFPIQSEGGNHSVRRESGIHNVTIRETKRPKEREKDKEYRRLTLTSANPPFCQFHDRTVSGQPPTERSQGLVKDGSRTSPAQSVPSPAGQQGATSVSTPPGDRNAGGIFFTAGGRPYVDPLFEITLIYEGRQMRSAKVCQCQH